MYTKFLNSYDSKYYKYTFGGVHPAVFKDYFWLYSPVSFLVRIGGSHGVSKSKPKSTMHKVNTLPNVIALWLYEVLLLSDNSLLHFI